EQDQVRRRVQDVPECAHGPGSAGDHVAALGECPDQRTTDGRVVLHQQQLRHDRTVSGSPVRGGALPDMCPSYRPIRLGSALPALRVGPRPDSGPELRAAPTWSGGRQVGAAQKRGAWPGAAGVLGVANYCGGLGAAAGGVAAASLWGWWRCHRGDGLELGGALAAGGLAVAFGGSWRSTEPGPPWLGRTCPALGIRTPPNALRRPD